MSASRYAIKKIGDKWRVVLVVTNDGVASFNSRSSAKRWVERTEALARAKG